MRRAIGIALLVVGLLQLGVRGVQRARADIPMWDFASVYAAARTWVKGEQPYELCRVVDTWRQTGVFADRSVKEWAVVYPPTSLAMLIPIAVLPAAAAMLLWLALTIALLVVQFIALARMAQLRWRDPRALILAGATLASAPLQFGVLSGQLSLPAISLSIIAFWCVGLERDRLAGALLGLACALKPQVAGPFVMYYLIVRRWRVAGYAMTLAGAIGALAVVAMHISQVDWLVGWTAGIKATGKIGGVNDYGWAGEFRDEILDLKLLLISFLHDPRSLHVVIGSVVVALLARYLQSLRMLQRTGRNELLALAGLSALSLLPIYHRVYDALLLSTALAWALAELDGPRRRQAIVLLAAMTPLLIPFDIVRSLAARMPAVLDASQSWWWQSFIAPHYATGLLVSTIALLWTMSRQVMPQPITVQQLRAVHGEEEMVLAS